MTSRVAPNFDISVMLVGSFLGRQILGKLLDLLGGCHVRWLQASLTLIHGLVLLGKGKVFVPMVVVGRQIESNANGESNKHFTS